MEKVYFEYDPLVFTTGAFLRPLKTSLHGKEIWLWVVTQFIDDTFKDGEIYNPVELGETKGELLLDTTQDMR